MESSFATNRRNDRILNILSEMMDHYSKSHQTYMTPIESMIRHMNSSSSTDMSMLFHLHGNVHSRMNDYHHTMRDILQFIRQIHQESMHVPMHAPVTSTQTPVPDPASATHRRGSHIAESILNALLQSSNTDIFVDTRAQTGGPTAEASFTFSMFPDGNPHGNPHGSPDGSPDGSPVGSPFDSAEEEDESMTNAQMEQCTETYMYQPPVSVTPEDTTVLEQDLHRTCPITLEDFEPGESLTKINVCGHVFRTAALRNWFMRHHQCPVCRRNVRDVRV